MHSTRIRSLFEILPANWSSGQISELPGIQRVFAVVMAAHVVVGDTLGGERQSEWYHHQMPSHDTTHRLVGADLAAGRYTLLAHIGEGGMADIFRARHNILTKSVAIKILKIEFADDEIIRERFVREARALSTVTHDNVVNISDFGTTPEGSVFFVMELLSGEPLSETLANSKPLSADRVKIIGLQICRALHAAHMRGVVHRDMKPENCWRMRRGANSDFIKVLDFGIAKVHPTDDTSSQQLTNSGEVFGTPEYMSPEQAQGKRADERSDVYSVGIVLYQMSTGKLPFTGETPISILNAQINTQPTPPRKTGKHLDCPQRLQALIMRSLAKDPDERFWSIRELAEALATMTASHIEVEVNTTSSAHEDTSLASDLRKTGHLLHLAVRLIVAIGIIVGILSLILITILMGGWIHSP